MGIGAAATRRMLAQAKANGTSRDLPIRLNQSTGPLRSTRLPISKPCHETKWPPSGEIATIAPIDKINHHADPIGPTGERSVCL